MVRKQNVAQKSKIVTGIFIALAAAGLFGLLPNLQNFDSAYSAIGNAEPLWLALGLVATLFGYFAAGGIYVALSTRRLSVLPSVAVQVAGSFVNRVLPAGIGAVSVSYRYLRNMGHPAASSAAIVTVNNLLGFIGNIVLLFALIVVMPAGSVVLRMPKTPPTGIAALMMITIFVAVVVLYSKRLMVLQALLSYGKQLQIYRRHRIRLLVAACLSLGLTASYALVVYASAHAVDISISYAGALFVMSVGVLGGIVLPTPGGLGAVEGGMVAAFVAAGFASSDALAATLIFRIFTFWFALVAGATMLPVARRKGYI